jgi:hypothetical protein
MHDGTSTWQTTKANKHAVGCVKVVRCFVTSFICFVSRKLGKYDDRKSQQQPSA